MILKKKVIYLGFSILICSSTLTTNLTTLHAADANTSPTVVKNTGNNDSNNIVDSGTVGTSDWHIVDHTLYIGNGNGVGTIRG